MKSIITLLFLFALIGCNRVSDLSEGDKNTYTWKGQLVYDCDGYPAKDISVYLERHTRIFDIRDPNPLDPSEREIEIIASDNTDESGNFSMTFKQGAGYALLFFAETADGRKRLDHIGTGNTNSTRNYALKNCLRTQLIIDNRGGYDSIFIHGFNEISSDFDTISVKWRDQNDWGRSTTANVIALNGQSFEGLYELRDAYYSYFRVIEWGVNRNDLLLSITNLTSDDSLPDDFNATWWDTKGYPSIDTVLIELD